MNELFRCPICGHVLPFTPPCRCGFVLRESDGIINFLTVQEEAREEAFLAAYDRVRSIEGWGQDDLALPFHPKRHIHIWKIRQQSFKKLESIVRQGESGLAVDVGAGNCWLTRYLDAWGYSAFAVDINVASGDGLRAGSAYLDQGSRFVRLRAPMERLPFVDGGITLIVANASFHYARDFRSVLQEFRRVLAPGGMIIIADSPFYPHDSDGERMIEERVEQFRREYGVNEALARRSGYLTREKLERALDGLNMQYEMHSVPPGLRRTYEKWRSRFQGRRIAEFPVIVIRHQ